MVHQWWKIFSRRRKFQMLDVSIIILLRIVFFTTSVGLVGIWIHYYFKCHLNIELNHKKPNCLHNNTTFWFDLFMRSKTGRIILLMIISSNHKMNDIIKKQISWKIMIIMIACNLYLVQFKNFTIEKIMKYFFSFLSSKVSNVGWIGRKVIKQLKIACVRISPIKSGNLSFYQLSTCAFGLFKTNGNLRAMIHTRKSKIEWNRSNYA